MHLSIENQGPLAPHLYDVLAFTAHEVRALTYLAMSPDESYTSTPLHTKVMALQGDPPAWRFGNHTPSGYCAAFAEYGLVTEESIVVRGRLAKAYTVAKEPRKLVLPFVGHLLDISLNADQSLLEIFGPPQTNSEQGTRPCQKRLAMLDALKQTKGKAIPMANITSLLAVHPAHADMVAEDLTAAKVINLKSSGRGQPTIVYTPRPELTDATFRQGVSELLSDVVSCITTHFNQANTASFTNEDLVGKLLELQRYEDTADFRQRIASYTFYLAKKRNLLDFKRTITQGNASREVIWATKEQMQLIGSVLKVIDGIRAPTEDYLEEGRHSVTSILGDQEIVNYLVAKAKRTARGRKILPEAQQIIREGLETVLIEDMWLSRREVQAALAEHNIMLDLTTVKRHLKLLVTLGKLAITETREGYKYSRKSSIRGR